MELQWKAFSKEAEEIFGKSAPMKQIATGYHFTEGPVWDSRENCLYFTDFVDERIYQWRPEGSVVLYREHSGRAVGLTLDTTGQLLAAETRTHCIAYTGSTESVPIVSQFEGNRLNSPNDVIFSKSGEILFTDPYSTALGAPRALGFNGIFAVSPKGAIRLVCEEMPRPNGLAFSLDESILYVNDTDQQHILAFAAREDGSFSRLGVFAKLDTTLGPGAADGMKIDMEGNVYVTGPGGIWVLDPEGTPIALLSMPEFTGNLCFGGKDGCTLFLTASTSVYALEVGIPGAGR